MFFSKVALKHGAEIFDILKEKQTSDGYVSHQILWKLFPNDGAKKRGFIYRKDERERIPQFLMVSAEKPTGIAGITVQSKPYDPQLSERQELLFSLVANPVIARKTEGKSRSVRHDVWMDAKKEGKEQGLDNEDLLLACEQAAKTWMVRQGTRHGFYVEENKVLVVNYQQNRFYKNRSSELIRYSTIQFEGKLVVVEPEKFRSMLFTGLGHAKGFGCGMMLIRKM